MTKVSRDMTRSEQKAQESVSNLKAGNEQTGSYKEQKSSLQKTQKNFLTMPAISHTNRIKKQSLRYHWNALFVETADVFLNGVEGLDTD